MAIHLNYQWLFVKILHVFFSSNIINKSKILKIKNLFVLLKTWKYSIEFLICSWPCAAAAGLCGAGVTDSQSITYINKISHVGSFKLISALKYRLLYACVFLSRLCHSFVNILIYTYVKILEHIPSENFLWTLQCHYYVLFVYLL